ncbi:hypothetical protein FH972_021400 [Carpinus fangiana]|uniref:TatD related DNase n=1 Tax=Carpinus fangiana TaxID=176857 RepID=A0A5N6KPL5_9ROSI|nr:hypothetical protein FH972_021400 [Carpinus fangiana]
MPTMNTASFTIMATRAEDQELVNQVANESKINASKNEEGTSASAHRDVIPSFGWHPWFSHLLYDDLAPNAISGRPLSSDEKTSHYKQALTPEPEHDTFIAELQDPLLLSDFLNETRARLAKHPNALVGEIGLDKAFRIPVAWLPKDHEQRDQSLTPGGREGRRLSPYRVSMNHQKKILLAQLKLAGEMQRPVSIHGVQAHGVVYETLVQTWKGHERPVMSKKEQKRHPERLHPDDEDESSRAVSGPKPYPPRICLHSYSGPPDPVKQYIHPSVPAEIFFSFSILVNFTSPAASKTAEVIRSIPDDRILVESDLHTAGKDMDEYMEAVVRKICELKQWSLTDGVKQLGRNWRHFVFGVTDTPS